LSGSRQKTTVVQGHARRARARVLAAMGVVLIVALAGRAVWLARRPAANAERGLSVLLITVDTLRADAIGAYGRADAGTPWMDRLAAAGVRFDDAHAHNVVTLPSHANILSGRYPMDHGVRDNAGFRFPAGMETLATLLKARGYGTGAFVSAFPLDARFGLARGFDVYEDSFVDAQARPAFLEQERPGTETVALARRWLDTQGDRPVFCWVHLYEPHAPYRPPPTLAARFPSKPYQGEVAAADAALAPLLEPLLARGVAGRTLVVLTADHGESLGEHGEATHGIFAYEATLRVPLILYGPRVLRARVERTPARHVDVLPTILAALALPVPAGLPGRSLLTAGTEAVEATTYFEALSGQLNRGWAPLYGVIRGRKKYIDLPIAEVYDLRADSGEATNLAAGSPPSDGLRAELAAFRSADHGVRPTAESAETREKLATLGYVSAGAAGPDAGATEDDDPKRLVALDAMLQEVGALYAAGDRRGALARGRELVRLRPQMRVSLLHLAHLERESGNLPAAIAALQKARALGPGDPTTLALLGAYLTEAGREGEAAALLEASAGGREPDVDVLVTRGLALAKAGRFDEALATIARAREVSPRSAMVLVHEGTVRLMAGDRARGREAFEAALRQNPRVARAHSSLGFLLAEDGQTGDALAHWKSAVALDPAESGKLVVLGQLLAQRGRAAEARPYLELFLASAPPAVPARDRERVRAWLAGK
jgi:arylsulfatase A-like enzyme/tetratricopeptide (TPR) repeat protein